MLKLRNYFNILYYQTYNTIYIKINLQHIKKVVTFFKLHSNLLFTQLTDLSFIDYLERKFRFELFYNVLSIKYNQRVIISGFLGENTTIDSITNIYLNSNWYEREVWDMLGIYFNLHPDFRRILTDYGFKGHPLRKDFPMTGFIEVRYDAMLKRIIYEALSLTQEFRVFILENSWEKSNFNLIKNND